MTPVQGEIRKFANREYKYAFVRELETNGTFNVNRVRRDLCNKPVYSKPLVYLDSASTSQKPQPVIDAISFGESCASSPTLFVRISEDNL